MLPGFLKRTKEDKEGIAEWAVDRKVSGARGTRSRKHLPPCPRDSVAGQVWGKSRRALQPAEAACLCGRGKEESDPSDIGRRGWRDRARCAGQQVTLRSVRQGTSVRLFTRLTEAGGATRHSARLWAPYRRQEDARWVVFIRAWPARTCRRLHRRLASKHAN
ncbi:hypothetical protein E2C01_035657 [Portunus trituberculatus]|uniref:Uncharacterized protein n=1 Tax=Portunus trituberculatus TaxID=210409 RepID=A0A5B7FC17_PORTR|nr:hypothetical protein [Portunus trituberculatus]